MALGSDIASNAGKVFGLELEGLGPEDQEYETAKGFIRFATDAAQRAAQLSSAGESEFVPRRAFIYAARRYAPGLLATVAPSPAVGTFDLGYASGRQAAGRWVRVARNQVVLYGI
jgi:hypothetical protein